MSLHKNKTDKKTLSEKKISTMISGQDIILLVTYNLRERDTNAQFIINSANDAGIPLVVISSRDPYDIASLSNVKPILLSMVLPDLILQMVSVMHWKRISGAACGRYSPVKRPPA